MSCNDIKRNDENREKQIKHLLLQEERCENHRKNAALQRHQKGNAKTTKKIQRTTKLNRPNQHGSSTRRTRWTIT